MGYIFIKIFIYSHSRVYGSRHENICHMRIRTLSPHRHSQAGTRIIAMLCLCNFAPSHALLAGILCFLFSFLFSAE